jgi:hypothetical protein
MSVKLIGLQYGTEKAKERLPGRNFLTDSRLRTNIDNGPISPKILIFYSKNPKALLIICAMNLYSPVPGRGVRGQQRLLRSS